MTAWWRRLPTRTRVLIVALLAILPGSVVWPVVWCAVVFTVVVMTWQVFDYRAARQVARDRGEAGWW